jgi:hypothetical protein
MRQSLCHPNEPLLTRFPLRHDVALDGPMSTLLQKRNPRMFPARGEFTGGCFGFVSACGSQVLAEYCEQRPHGLRAFVPCAKIGIPSAKIRGNKTL